MTRPLPSLPKLAAGLASSPRGFSPGSSSLFGAAAATSSPRLPTPSRLTRSASKSKPAELQVAGGCEEAVVAAAAEMTATSCPFSPPAETARSSASDEVVVQQQQPIASKAASPTNLIMFSPLAPSSRSPKRSSSSEEDENASGNPSSSKKRRCKSTPSAGVAPSPLIPTAARTVTEGVAIGMMREAVANNETTTTAAPAPAAIGDSPALLIDMTPMPNAAHNNTLANGNPIQFSAGANSPGSGLLLGSADLRRPGSADLLGSADLRRSPRISSTRAEPPSMPPIPPPTPLSAAASAPPLMSALSIDTPAAEQPAFEQRPVDVTDPSERPLPKPKAETPIAQQEVEEAAPAVSSSTTPLDVTDEEAAILAEFSKKKATSLLVSARAAAAPPPILEELPPSSSASSSSSSSQPVARKPPIPPRPTPSSAASAAPKPRVTPSSGATNPNSARPTGSSAAASSSSVSTTQRDLSQSTARSNGPCPIAAAATAARGGKNGLLTALSEAVSKLQDVRDEDWEKRTAAIKAIPPLLSKAAELKCLDALLGGQQDGLHKPLGVQVVDLRSQVVRVACSTLSEIAMEHGRTIAPLAAGVLPSLLKNLYVSKQAMSITSHETALTLVQQAPTQAVLQVLLSSTTDTHHQTRRGCAEYIAALLTSSQTGASAGPSASERQVNATLGAVQKMISDADPKVREAAAKCFWVVHTHWPTAGEQMKGKLDPSQLKLINRVAPKKAGATAAAGPAKAAKPWARK